MTLTKYRKGIARKSLDRVLFGETDEAGSTSFVDSCEDRVGGFYSSLWLKNAHSGHSAWRNDARSSSSGITFRLVSSTTPSRPRQPACVPLRWHRRWGRGPGRSSP